MYNTIINNNSIYRPEYPRPQFQREHWINLNGEWELEFDQSCSGIEKGLYSSTQEFSGKIIVPFCPQSELSGVGYKDFIRGIWYRKKVVLSEEQCAGRVVLHFGAVDYSAVVYVNKKEAGISADILPLNLILLLL